MAWARANTGLARAAFEGIISDSPAAVESARAERRRLEGLLPTATKMSPGLTRGTFAEVVSRTPSPPPSPLAPARRSAPTAGGGEGSLAPRAPPTKTATAGGVKGSASQGKRPLLRGATVGNLFPRDGLVKPSLRTDGPAERSLSWTAHDAPRGEKKGKGRKRALSRNASAVEIPAAKTRGRDGLAVAKSTASAASGETIRNETAPKLFSVSTSPQQNAKGEEKAKKLKGQNQPPVSAPIRGTDTEVEGDKIEGGIDGSMPISPSLLSPTENPRVGLALVSPPLLSAAMDRSTPLSLPLSLGPIRQVVEHCKGPNGEIEVWEWEEQDEYEALPLTATASTPNTRPELPLVPVLSSSNAHESEVEEISSKGERIPSLVPPCTNTGPKEITWIHGKVPVAGTSADVPRLDPRLLSLKRAQGKPQKTSPLFSIPKIKTQLLKEYQRGPKNFKLRAPFATATSVPKTGLHTGDLSQVVVAMAKLPAAPSTQDLQERVEALERENRALRRVANPRAASPDVAGNEVSNGPEEARELSRDVQEEDPSPNDPTDHREASDSGNRGGNDVEQPRSGDANNGGGDGDDGGGDGSDSSENGAPRSPNWRHARGSGSPSPTMERPSPPRPTPGKRPINVDPMPFKPTAKDFDVESWIRKTENAFALARIAEEDKIPLALAKFDTDPETRWALYAEEQGYAPTDSVPFAVMRKWLMENFSDPTREYHAREALKAIRQEGPIKDYVAAFERHVSLIPKDRRPAEPDLIHYFVHGLKRSLQTECGYDRRNGKVWRSFRRCRDNALIQGTLQESNAVQYVQGDRPKGPSNNDKRKHVTFSDNKNPSKRRPDARGRRDTKRPRPFVPRDKGPQGSKTLVPISDELRKKLMKEGKCFKCGEKNHRTRDCTNAPKDWSKEN